MGFKFDIHTFIAISLIILIGSYSATVSLQEYVSSEDSPDPRNGPYTRTSDGKWLAGASYAVPAVSCSVACLLNPGVSILDVQNQ